MLTHEENETLCRVGPTAKMGQVMRRYWHPIALRVNVDCNYLQMWEGGCDSSHVGVLHSNIAHPGWMDETSIRGDDIDNPANLAVEDNAPSLEVEDTEYGFHYAATRRGPGQDGKIEVKNISVVPAIMPYGRIIPAPSFFFHVFEASENDVRAATYIVIHGDLPVERETLIKLLGLSKPRYWNSRTDDFTAGWRDNFGQNREAMTREWGGLGGGQKEDAIMGLSMGPIFDRAQEHLVAADHAVVRLRRRHFDSVKLAESCQEPLGATAEDITNVSCTSDAPLDRPWQTAGHRHEILPRAAD